MVGDHDDERPGLARLGGRAWARSHDRRRRRRRIRERQAAAEHERHGQREGERAQARTRRALRSAARGHCGQGVSAPVMGRQRSSGRRAAVASSSRRTGVRDGAPRGAARVARAPRAATASSASAKASSVVEGLGLGRLDEQALLDDEREVDRRRVEAVVDEALRDVERPDPGGSREGSARAGHELVLAGPVVGQVVGIADARAQVVRGQHGVLAHLAQAGRRRAHGCRHTRARGRRRCPGRRAPDRSRSVARPVAPGGTSHPASRTTSGLGQERREVLGDRRRARRPAHRRRAASRTSCAG